MTPEELTAELQRTTWEIGLCNKRLELLRKRRARLVQQHPGQLREVAEAAGVSYQRVQQIRTEGQR